jgi:hypothetical protein
VGPADAAGEGQEGRHRGRARRDLPDRLRALVEGAIVRHVDADAWAKEKAVEESHREVLLRLAGEAA